MTTYSIDIYVSKKNNLSNSALNEQQADDFFQRFLINASELDTALESLNYSTTLQGVSFRIEKVDNLLISTLYTEILKIIEPNQVFGI
jgi:hypothetical protein